MKPSETEAAAQALLQCRLHHRRLEQLPRECTPATLEQAYEIQQALTRLLGEPVAGYKIGLTNAAAQRAARADAPIVGRLYPGDIFASPAELLPRHSRMRAVEAEILFEIGDALRPADAPFSRGRIAASIADVFAGVEVCDSRFRDCDRLSLPSIVADNSNAGVVVIGERLPCWSQVELDALPVVLSRPGQEPTAGSSANVLRNPLNSLQWLANWLAERGIVLAAGDIVASGTCTPIIMAQPGERFVAEFGARARAEVEFARNEAGHGQAHPSRTSLSE